MQGLQPQNLTNTELRKYAALYGVEKLSQEWLLELAKRFTNPASVRPEYRV
jgi:hypothetical protein